MPTLGQNKAVALGCVGWLDDPPTLVLELERDPGFADKELYDAMRGERPLIRVVR